MVMDEADDVMSFVAETVDEGIANVACSAGDKTVHGLLPEFIFFTEGVLRNQGEANRYGKDAEREGD
jgi:hypothetical protein